MFIAIKITDGDGKFNHSLEMMSASSSAWNGHSHPP